MSGKGIPNDLAQNTSIDVLPQNVVPETNAVVTQYLAEQGQLTQFTGFGSDPLEGSSYLQEKRHHIFLSSGRYNYDTIFMNVISSDGKTLVDAILYYKNTTIRLSKCDPILENHPYRGIFEF